MLQKLTRLLRVSHRTHGRNKMVELRSAQSENDYALAKDLFVAYASQLGVDLSFQNFSNELEKIRTEYGPPTGVIILVFDEKENAIGCFAIRKFQDSVCELKRMYLRNDFQGKGIGKAMLKNAIVLGRELGYERMRLDTLPTMKSAIKLYSKVGFYEIEPYRFNPIEGTKYFEIDLVNTVHK
jgi:ribosomal protein S18 acetylase RimI-like enzyme